MDADPARADPPASLPAPQGLEDRARAYVAAARSPATVRAYRSDWADFTAWCASYDACALPAEPVTVALYLTDLARTRSVATLQRRLSAVAVAHRTAGHRSPTGAEEVRLVWSGIRRTHGVAPDQATPATVEVLRAMLEPLGDRFIDVRDRALLVVGFASALRRSELVALDTRDLTEVAEGLVVNLRRSKTDQEAAGRRIGLPYGSRPPTCPVRTWRAWTAAAGDGPAWRSVDRHGHLGGRLSDRAVALVVKRRAEAAGYDPGHFSGHSLRAGFATSAAAAGTSERAIMRHTGHHSPVVLRGYIRDGSLWRENAAAEVGL